MAVAERAVTKQMLEVEKLRRDGLDTALAERTPEGFEDNLQVLRNNRATIARLIEVDQGLA